MLNQWDGSLRLNLCWGLVITWLVTTIAASVLTAPAVGIISALLIPVILLIHGSILYGWKGVIVYAIIGIVVGFSLEASSVANGFPFGLFVHNQAGLKLLGVPIYAITGYMKLGWFALMLAKLIVLDLPWHNQPVSRFAIPPVAALILAGIDLPLDPIGATITQQWTYAHPSGQFGVPFSNFIGWIFTGWVLFQIFLFVEERFSSLPAAQDKRFWLIPVLFWLGMAVNFPLAWMQATPATVAVGDRTFLTTDIFEAAVITSIFTQVTVSVFALARLLSRPQAIWRGAGRES